MRREIVSKPIDIPYHLPIANLATAYLAGIFTSQYKLLNPSSQVVIISTALLLILIISLLCYRKYFWISKYILYTTLFLLGMAPDHLNQALYKKNNTEYTSVKEVIHSVRVPVIKMPRKGKKNFFITINENSINHTFFIFFNNDSIAKQIDYGDTLIITSKWYQNIHNPQHTYIYSNPNNTLIKKGKEISFTCNILRLKKRSIESIDPYFNDKHIFSVAKAISAGERAEIPSDIKNNAVNSGTMHIMALSGLHTGYIILIVTIFTIILGNYPASKWIKTIIIIASLIIFSIATESPNSVIRASLMASLYFIAELKQSGRKIGQTAILSLVLIVSISPESIKDIGLLLSYSAIAGIVMLFPVIRSQYSGTNRYFAKIWDMLSISIACQIATLPLSISISNKIPLYFLSANLICVPLAGVVVFSFYLTIFSHYCHLYLVAKIFAYATTYSTHIILSISKKISAMPYSTLDIQPDKNQLIIMGIAIAIIVATAPYNSSKKRGIALGAIVSIILYLL